MTLILTQSLARKAAALDMAVNEALAHPRITRLMQVLFGALSQLAHAHAQARGGDGGDAATEVARVPTHPSTHLPTYDKLTG